MTGKGAGSWSRQCVGNQRSDTRAGSCCSQWKPHTFLLCTSISGMLALLSPSEACAQCIIHTSVSIYIPAYSPIPAYNGLWPRRSWDHAAISICSCWLQTQRKSSRIAAAQAGSMQQEHRDHCAGPSVFSFCCLQRYSMIKAIRLWHNSPDSGQAQQHRCRQ